MSNVACVSVCYPFCIPQRLLKNVKYLQDRLMINLTALHNIVKYKNSINPFRLKKNIYTILVFLFNPYKSFIRNACT